MLFETFIETIYLKEKINHHMKHKCFLHSLSLFYEYSMHLVIYKIKSIKKIANSNIIP